MNKTLLDLMDELHKLTTIELIDILTNGIPVFDRESGELVDRAKAPPAYFAAAIKLLKDNAITVERRPGSPIDRLNSVVAEIPAFDADEDFDLSMMN